MFYLPGTSDHGLARPLTFVHLLPEVQIGGGVWGKVAHFYQNVQRGAVGLVAQPGLREAGRSMTGPHRVFT